MAHLATEGNAELTLPKSSGTSIINCTGSIIEAAKNSPALSTGIAYSTGGEIVQDSCADEAGINDSSSTAFTESVDIRKGQLHVFHLSPKLVLLDPDHHDRFCSVKAAGSNNAIPGGVGTAQQFLSHFQELS